MDQSGDFVRIFGNVTFVDDLAIKEKIFEVAPMLKNIYQSADNPIFEVFSLSNGQAKYFSFDATKNKVVNF